MEIIKSKIIFILILALSLRLINLDQSLWLDEAISALAAKDLNPYDLIFNYSFADFHPPGYFIILWSWIKLFGFSEISLRLPSVIFGTLTVYLIYLIGKKIHSPNFGLIASFFLAINPLHIYYSQEARMYSLATFAISLNLFFFFKLLKNEGSKGLIFSALLVLLSDYLAYLIFPAQLMVMIFERRFLIRYLKAMVIPILLFTAWLPSLLKQLTIGKSAIYDIPNWQSVVGANGLKSLGLTYIKFIIGRISYPDKQIYYLTLLPVLSLFSFIFLKSISQFKEDHIKKLLIIITVPIILAQLITFIFPIYSYFRLLFLIVPFLILLSLGISNFKSRLPLLLVSTIFLVASLIYLFNQNYHREDWKGLVNFLKTEKAQKLILMESTAAFSPFDYYSQGDLRAMGGLQFIPTRSIEDINTSAFEKEKTVIVVDYLVEVFDPNRFLYLKLESLGFKEEKKYNFRGVGFITEFTR